MLRVPCKNKGIGTCPTIIILPLSVFTTFTRRVKVLDGENPGHSVLFASRVLTFDLIGNLLT